MENLITDWNETIGLTVLSVKEATLDADDEITLTLIRFTNGKFLIQHDQEYYTTKSRLLYESDLDDEVRGKLDLK